jgi:hypothetical protein
MMWPAGQVRAIQEYALSHAWSEPQKLDLERAMLTTKDGWAVALSVNR